MKNLLIGLLALGTVSAFAYDSEFEKGFEIENETCAQEVWICSLRGTAIYSAGVTTGATRADTILKLNPFHISHLLQIDEKVKCKKLDETSVSTKALSF